MGYNRNPGCHCQRESRPKSHPSCRCAHSLELGGIQAQLRNAETAQLDNGEAILFDIILQRTSPDIAYNKDTGKFTLCKKGTYLINWDVAVEGSYYQPYITIALTADNSIINAATIPVTIGQISSTAMVNVTEEPVVVSLINDTNDRIQLSRYTPVANITITKIISGCKEAPEHSVTKHREHRHRHHSHRCHPRYVCRCCCH